MSEGFGQLASLLTLNMEYCKQIQSLPESESHHSKNFFLMSEGFGLLWPLTKGVFGRLQPAPVVDQTGSFLMPRRQG